MPELIDESQHNSAWFSPLSRLGERVAALEATTESLKDDSRVIRSTLHEVNNKLQLFVIAEQGSTLALKTISTQLTDHTTALTSLASARDQVKGIWWAIGRVCALVVGVFALIGSITAFVGWMLEHHLSFSIH